MASTTFSGPVTSTNGFIGAVTGNVTGNVTATTLAAATAKLTVIALASLPAAAAGNAGTIYYVSGTSSGNTLVFSDGTDNIDLVTGVAVVA
jgi:hypothetical protein